MSPMLLLMRDSDTSQQLYVGQCAGCHGADAHGADREPPLAGSRSRTRSFQQLRAFIRRHAEDPVQLEAARVIS